MVGSISVYIVTRPRPVIPLTVSGGSTIGTIKGNLTSVSSVNPLSVYFKDGRAKVELAVARGKARYDKRHAIAERDAKRETQRAMKGERE